MSPSTTAVTNTALTDGPKGTFSNGAPGPFHKRAPSGGPKRTLLHIDDVLHVDVKMDNLSIEKVLESAEHSIKMAESLKDFGRPDMALREYVKASIITLHVIPAHKDWLRLRSDNKGKAARYNTLIGRIDAKSAEFDQVKVVIKEDNKRTGVRPSSQDQGQGVGPANFHLANGSHETAPHAAGRAAPNSNGSHSQSVDSSVQHISRDHDERPTSLPRPKPRPAIQPKPQALHGNSIRPVVSSGVEGSKAAVDLNERFAKLRSANGALGQEPRTHQARPSGPRGMPGAPSHIPMPHALPDMPKVPEAIYSPSPARGSVSSDIGHAPLTGTPRGMYSRTNSVVSISGENKTPGTHDYFNATHTGGSGHVPARKAKAVIPPGDDINAQDLVDLMQAGTRDISILLIDVRARDQYDEGHIPSQFTICVERDILQRENPSASQIAESMILAPEAEHNLFDRRHEFDMIVFYDDASERIQKSPETPAEIALSSLWNALKLYDFTQSSSPETRPLKLLKGGIEAWIDLVGPNSLQTTSSVGARQLKRSRPLGPRPGPRRNATKPIQDAEEAKRWEEAVQDPEQAGFIRTKDDFLRRFPPVSALQESMTSPVRDNESPRHSFASARQPNAYAALPSPPTRPAPAVPRQNHSDTLATEDEDRYVSIKRSTAGVGKKKKNRIGLYNPGNWCYGNSSFQALFNSGAFADELSSGQWVNNWRVPMKADEKIAHPQLMAKIISSLFHWMQEGKFEAIKAKTLMDYCYHINSKDGNGNRKGQHLIFGGTAQQDAQEFMAFLFAELHDETNRVRNRTGHPQQPDPGLSALASALTYWRSWKQYNDSIIDKYWRCLEVVTTHCTVCGHNNSNITPSDIVFTSIPPQFDGEVSLYNLLDEDNGTEQLEDYKCDKCSTRGSSERRHRFGRLPDRLCIAIKRFEMNYYSDTVMSRKKNNTVTFPLRNLDLTPYTVQATEQQQSPIHPHHQHRHHHRHHSTSSNGTAPLSLPLSPPPPPPKAGASIAADLVDDMQPFTAPFAYDCYCIIVHGGTLTSGHYRAFVRDEASDDPSAWHQFDDHKVKPVKLALNGRNEPNEALKKVFMDEYNGSSAYMLFYKRRSH
ncbi:uncharacterized protein E0L32_012028 [Thyridium curvatum]|uniref:Ubiquitin carboxyl-terminal hydrolase n=1 Tax=Thyridium curvatum TaxID=1093900 RepID=A0A507B3J1_9PEZI|nr:uncharacterized protein E0L32_012028 [Thyridium curvatum]TPX17675.1 hypothetical protein E0L32_012028 [Thyridium curvatum]